MHLSLLVEDMHGCIIKLFRISLKLFYFITNIWLVKLQNWTEFYPKCESLPLSKNTSLFQKCNTACDAGVAMEKYIEPIIHDLFIAIRMHILRSNSNFDLGKKKNQTKDWGR